MQAKMGELRVAARKLVNNGTCSSRMMRSNSSDGSELLGLAITAPRLDIIEAQTLQQWSDVTCAAFWHGKAVQAKHGHGVAQHAELTVEAVL